MTLFSKPSCFGESVSTFNGRLKGLFEVLDKGSTDTCITYRLCNDLTLPKMLNDVGDFSIISTDEIDRYR